MYVRYALLCYQTNFEIRSTVASVQNIGLPARKPCSRRRRNELNHSQDASWKIAGRALCM